MDTPLPLLSLCLDKILKNHEVTGYYTDFSGYQYGFDEKGTMYTTTHHTYLSLPSGCYELVDNECLECTLFECIDTNNIYSHWVLPDYLIQQSFSFLSTHHIYHLQWEQIQEEPGTPPGSPTDENIFF